MSTELTPLQAEQHLAAQYLERPFRIRPAEHEDSHNSLLIAVDLARDEYGDGTLLISAYYNARLVILKTATITANLLTRFGGVPELMMLETWRDFRQLVSGATPQWFAHALSPEADNGFLPPHASRQLRLPGDHGRPLPANIRRLYQREFFS